MDSSLAISARGVGKTFRIGQFEDKSDSIMTNFVRAITRPVTNYRKYRSLYRFDDLEVGAGGDDILWALRNVSFDVRKGEILGIVGMNGAGKSTLLKILASITPPSRGRIEINGRVSSLLEVGTGFHPELTGRENVYLNGTMMGMSKQEVDQKFDEIVDFSGVERFLDTPVKRYSSGMRVRLAFAVAAHLEPEILIVDEVLAVGDAAFQRKCLDKMENAGEDGRTVLFVSHNLPAVTRLCSRALLLKEGQVIMDDTANAVVAHYLSVEKNLTSSKRWDPQELPGDSVACLHALRIKGCEGETLELAEVQDQIGLEMRYEVLEDGHCMMPSFDLYDEHGELIFISVETDDKWINKIRPPGVYCSTAWIPKNLMNEGTFYVGCHLTTSAPWHQHFNAQKEVSIQVVDNMKPDSARGAFMGTFPGKLRPKLTWQTDLKS